MTFAGSIAGLIAVAGIFVMTVLYVRQRRTVERLRRWAGTAPERSRPHVAAATRRDRPGRPRWRAVAISAAALVVAGVAVYATVERSAAPASSSAVSRPARVDDIADLTRAQRRHIAVAVLNGSHVTGLAEATAQRLAALGFAQDVVTNALAPTAPGAAVAYADADARPAALAIASVLHARRPGHAAAQARALARHAEVIVTVGSRTRQ